MNIIIHADITFSGQTFRTVYECITYNSSFTTHYVYSFSLKLYKKSSTSSGDVYEGTLELLDASAACSHKYYHQIARRGDVVAEVKVNIDGCISKMPEDQSPRNLRRNSSRQAGQDSRHGRGATETGFWGI